MHIPAPACSEQRSFARHSIHSHRRDELLSWKIAIHDFPFILYWDIARRRALSRSHTATARYRHRMRHRSQDGDQECITSENRFRW